MRSITTALAMVGVLVFTAPADAQEPPAADVPDPIEVGAMAPDFAIPGATRHGVLAEPVTLSEYAGKTVVLAFFFRARTRG